MAPRRLLLRAGIFLFVIAAVAPARALAQGGQSGSIVGSLFDSGGTPLRGVKVSASSETQIGGARVAYTNEEGFFRLPALEPGVFQLRASAPRMKTVVVKDVPGGHQRAGGGEPGARGRERHRGGGGGGAGAPDQHQQGQRARGVRSGHGGGPAPWQPGQRPLPGGQRCGGRHQRTHPGRRGQPDHLHAGRFRHPRAGAHAEDLGGLRSEHRRLRRGQPDGLGRLDQHGHQVRIQPPRVRIQRHRRHQLAAPRHRQPGFTEPDLPVLRQPAGVRSHHQGPSLVPVQHRGLLPADRAGPRTWRGSSRPTPLPEVGAERDRQAHLADERPQQAAEPDQLRLPLRTEPARGAGRRPQRPGGPARAGGCSRG